MEAVMSIGTRCERYNGYAALYMTLAGCAAFMFAGCAMNAGVSDGTDVTAQDSQSEGSREDLPLTGFTKRDREEPVTSILPSFSRPPEGGPLRGSRQALSAGVEIFDIYFPVDRWGLVEEERKSLASSAAFLKKHPKAPLLIEGYCDERGSREYNLMLGDKRARETREFLKDLGVRNPVAIKSYGKERSICSDRVESCYWQNRRAHLRMQAEP
jgi:outer membrane protein OmpA-like peptidoglycan-associated protein